MVALKSAVEETIKYDDGAVLYMWFDRTLFLLVASLAMTGWAAAIPIGSLQGAQAPSVVAGLVENQRINVYISETPSDWSDEPAPSTQTVGFVMNGSMVGAVKASRFQNASFEFIVSRRVVSQAMNSSSPRSAFVEAYRSGKIRYRGVGTWNTVVSSTTKAVIRTGSRAISSLHSISSWFR